MGMIIRAALALVLSILAWEAPLYARSQYPADPQVAAEVRQGLEEILDLWRNGNYALLCERTRSEGRESREEFVRRIAGASFRPACCWEKLQDVKVSVRGGDDVTVHGRFGLEGGPSGAEYSTRSVRLVREDGVWKAFRTDLLALAGKRRKR